MKLSIYKNLEDSTVRFIIKTADKNLLFNAFFPSWFKLEDASFSQMISFVVEKQHFVINNLEFFSILIKNFDELKKNFIEERTKELDDQIKELEYEKNHIYFDPIDGKLIENLNSIIEISEKILQRLIEELGWYTEGSPAKKQQIEKIEKEEASIKKLTELKNLSLAQKRTREEKQKILDREECS